MLQWNNREEKKKHLRGILCELLLYEQGKLKNARKRTHKPKSGIVEAFKATQQQTHHVQDFDGDEQRS